MRPLVAFPQKRPLLLLTPRPPQLETPMAVFDRACSRRTTRSSCAGTSPDIPTTVDAAAHRIAVSGAVTTPLLALARRPAPEMAPRSTWWPSTSARATAAGCSRRASPAVSGRTARWAMLAGRGVRLRDILGRAGLARREAGAVPGLERPGVAGRRRRSSKSLNDRRRARRRRDRRVPDERRADAAAQRLSGAPGRSRLVRDVLGEDALRDHRCSIASTTILDEDGLSHPRHAARQRAHPGSTGFATEPISKMNVRSFAPARATAAKLDAAGRQPLRGIAFDGGEQRSRRCEISTDGGATWRDTTLEQRLRPRTASGAGTRRWSATAGTTRWRCARLANGGTQSGDADLESERLHAQYHRDLQGDESHDRGRLIAVAVLLAALGMAVSRPPRPHRRGDHDDRAPRRCGMSVQTRPRRRERPPRTA